MKSEQLQSSHWQWSSPVMWTQSFHPFPPSRLNTNNLTLSHSYYLSQQQQSFGGGGEGLVEGQGGVCNGASWSRGGLVGWYGSVSLHGAPTQSACVCWSDCPRYRGSCVPVPENTPLLELINAAHADSPFPLLLVSIFNHQPAPSLLWLRAGKTFMSYIWLDLLRLSVQRKRIV